jgi:hypothetical protein
MRGIDEGRSASLWIRGQQNMSCHNENAFRVNPVVRLLTVLSVAATLLFAAPAHALDSGDIVVASMKGEVHYVSNGAERALRVGAVLELPASVRTGRDGAIVLRQSATSVDVGPDTLLEFPALEKHGAPVDRIVQPRGNAFYDVGKRAGRKLRVETPYLVGVIKGTQFNVAATDESTTISLFEGRLEVRATDDSAVVDLVAGEIAARKRGEKTISVMKMDPGKAPPTQRPTSGGDGGPGAPGSPRSSDDDRLVASPGIAPDPTVGTTLELRGNDDADAGVNTAVAATGANADVRGVEANASAEVAAVDPSVNSTVDVNAGGANVDVGAGTSLGSAASVDAGVSAGVDLGNGVGVDAGASVGVDAGAVGANVGAATSVTVGDGAISVDLGANANVDVGSVAGADLGAAANVDVGAGSIAVDLGTNANVDVGGAAAVDAGAGAAVDLGTTDVAANVDVGAGAAVGDVAAVDADVSTAVDLGATPDVAANVDVDTSVAGVDAGVSTTVDVAAGNVDLGASVAGVDLGVNLDLGLGSDPVATPDTSTDPGTTDTTTDTTTTTPPPPVVDLGGLLDGLLRRPGRR